MGFRQTHIHNIKPNGPYLSFSFSFFFVKACNVSRRCPDPLPGHMWNLLSVSLCADPHALGPRGPGRRRRRNGRTWGSNQVIFECDRGKQAKPLDSGNYTAAPSSLLNELKVAVFCLFLFSNKFKLNSSCA